MTSANLAAWTHLLHLVRTLENVTKTLVIARAVFGEAIETYRRLGSPPKIGQALVGIAMPEMQFRNVGAAARYLEEAPARR